MCPYLQSESCWSDVVQCRKIRSYFNGTNRGDVIYGVKMLGFDHPDIWTLSVKQKRELYGKARIAVGSKGPEGTENEGWIQWVWSEFGCQNNMTNSLING